MFFLPALWCAAQTTDTGVRYHLESTAPLSRFTPKQRDLLQKLNRADAAHLGRMRRIVVPSRWDLDQLAYSPMPGTIAQLAGTPQAVIVNLPAQVFGAYEFGKVVRWGPVSSGRSGRRTPAGHYHLNWNARIRVSSENDSWIMPWYFNFDSIGGLGFHEYSLPGVPASHGCVRLLRPDAKWLFSWGRGWTRDPEGRSIINYGTPVIILGQYDFRSPKPWLRPDWWTAGVTVSESDLAVTTMASE